MQLSNSVRAELAAAWLAYLEVGDMKVVQTTWVSDGVSRPNLPKRFDEKGDRLPPIGDGPMGQRTERSRLEAKLQMFTGNCLRNLRRAAIKAGEDPPPNWFKMTLWHDGRHEMSFTYNAAQQAIRDAESAEIARRAAEQDAIDAAEAAKPISDEERRRRRQAEKARPLALEHFERIYQQPEDPEAVTDFLRAHAEINSPRDWEEFEVGLELDEIGATRVFQRMRSFSRRDFVPLPMDDPQRVIDALEHLRVRHGESGEHRRNLLVRLMRRGSRLEWGNKPG